MVKKALLDRKEKFTCFFLKKNIRRVNVYFTNWRLRLHHKTWECRPSNLYFIE
jgi:hypothetical protein